MDGFQSVVSISFSSSVRTRFVSNPRAFPRDEELVAARRVTILIYRKKHT